MSGKILGAVAIILLGGLVAGLQAEIPTFGVDTMLSSKYALCTDLSPNKEYVLARSCFGSYDEGYVRFDANTHTKLTPDYHAGAAPWTGFFSADSNSLWTSLYYDGIVKQINLADGNVIASVAVGSWPTYMTFDQEHRYLYVGVDNPYPEAISTIKVVDTTSQTVLGISATLNGATGQSLAISADQQFLYATSVQPGQEQFYKIRRSDMSILGTFSISGIYDPGFSISPDGTKAYIPDVGAGKIKVIDASSMTLSEQWDCPNVVGFWVSPDGTYALTKAVAATEVDLGIFDLTSHAIVQTLPITGLCGLGVHEREPPSWDVESGRTTIYVPICAETGGGVAVLTPEPATLSLLALGGLAMLRRRK